MSALSPFGRLQPGGGTFATPTSGYQPYVHHLIAPPSVATPLAPRMVAAGSTDPAMPSRTMSPLSQLGHQLSRPITQLGPHMDSTITSAPLALDPNRSHDVQVPHGMQDQGLMANVLRLFGCSLPEVEPSEAELALRRRIEDFETQIVEHQRHARAQSSARAPVAWSLSPTMPADGSICLLLGHLVPH